jgi:hypothetical protein
LKVVRWRLDRALSAVGVCSRDWFSNFPNQRLSVFLCKLSAGCATYIWGPEWISGMEFVKCK